jgi:hypothetical protein
LVPLLGNPAHPHAPRDVPLTRARTVATNVLEENMLMTIHRSRNQGYFDCAVPIHTPANINAVLSLLLIIVHL